MVDTNVVVGAYLPGLHASAIEAAMAKDSHWVAPYLWRLEFRNVLALYLRKELMALQDAKRVALLAESRMRNREYWSMADRVLGLAKSSGCTAYDCEFVSLAMDLNVQLVTIDKKVLKQFPVIAVSPEEFVSR
ncbi:type II toxin-antitoxin system VapC family toxin [Pontiella sulfatireligans]|uniref:type II toxin-antitoxin system VapC family toxin n=1 Tax=Pontiella sulfatireligans TaxID=2750658 RepID=UPI001FEB0CBE|nr:type II toxin-antitoxin system VapC family toxin [Pontiella sulfatireligans]